jgi:hypothetical protein
MTVLKVTQCYLKIIAQIIGVNVSTLSRKLRRTLHGHHGYEPKKRIKLIDNEKEVLFESRVLF